MKNQKTFSTAYVDMTEAYSAIGVWKYRTSAARPHKTENSRLHLDEYRRI